MILNADHMVQFLNKYFSGDNNKEYYCVDAAENQRKGRICAEAM